MQQNILNSPDVTKIIIIYTDGNHTRRKEQVDFLHMDKKTCYLAGSVPNNFTKLGWRTKADIIAYTQNGTYSSTVIIRETTKSSNLHYKVDIPKAWEFAQRRNSTRKDVDLPVKIKLNDGVEIKTNICNLSNGGFSVIGDYKFTTVQTRFAGVCEIEFPDDDLTDLPNKKFIQDVIYVRQKACTEEYSLQDKTLFSFRFLNMTENNAKFIKKILKGV